MKIPPLLTPAALLDSFNLSSHEAFEAVPGVRADSVIKPSPSASVGTRHYVCPPSNSSDCEWALVVALQDEACLLGNSSSHSLGQASNSPDASSCPWLVDGFSVYDPAKKREPLLLYSNMTNLDDTPLPIFLLTRETYRELSTSQPDYLYEDLWEWSQNHPEAVYEGVATHFSKLIVHNSDDNSNSGDQHHSVEGFVVSAKGHVKNRRGYSLDFNLHAQRVGQDRDDEYWNVQVESHDLECRTCQIGDQAIIPVIEIVVILLSCTLFAVCVYREFSSREPQSDQNEDEDDSSYHRQRVKASNTQRTLFDDDEEEDDEEMSTN